MIITHTSISNESVNKTTLYILFSAYYLVAIFKGFFLYLYINKRLTLNSKLLVYYLSIPAYISILMLINNHVTHYLFYFEGSQIIHGPLFLLIFLHYTLYAAAFAQISIKQKIHYAKITKVFITLFFFYFSSLVFIQLTTNAIQPINLLSSLLLLMIFTILETPILQENKQTGTLNRNSFQNYVESLDTENVKIVLIRIKNIEILNTFETESNVLKGYHDTIQKTKKEFPKSYFYNLTPSILAVSIPASVDTQKFINFLINLLGQSKSINLNVSPLSLVFASSDPFKSFNSATSFSHALKYGIDLLESSKDTDICYNLTEKEAELYVRQQKIFKQLHYAITLNQIELKIQPIYDVKKKTILKGEVLSRLQIPGIGYVPSFEFISMAEKNGSINEFGLSVFNELCHLLNTVKLPLEQISFNISMLHFMQKSLPNDLLNIVKQHEIDPKIIIIEITETSRVIDWNILKDNMYKLKAAGFTLSLDDFGTGFASLEYFATLPFDIIKFDRNLLIAAEESKKAFTALSSTIHMVSSLGYATVIEGVETESQNRMALDMGIDYIQGYLYGKPLKLYDFAKILNS